MQCNADALFKPVVDPIDATGKKIEQAIMVLSQPSMEAAKEIDAKEMRKKFKSMSREEQMKLAMEMGKKMGMGKSPVRESDDVLAAQEECIRVNGQVGNDIQNAGPIYQRREKLSQDRATKHQEIEKWQETEARKLPQISTGEMSAAEPRALHALLVKVMDKHLAVENEYLKGLQKEWKTTWERYKSLYAPLQERLIAIRHGEDAKNPETRRALLNAQGLMVAGTKDLVTMSRDATVQGANWWGRKLMLDKNKP